jgi:hypothetical protein
VHVRRLDAVARDRVATRPQDDDRLPGGLFHFDVGGATHAPQCVSNVRCDVAQDGQVVAKITPGTGLKGADLPCHCPYRGYTGSHKRFFTPEQIEYAKSVVMRQVSDRLTSALKKLEFDHKPRGAFGIGMSLKVKPGQRPPIQQYRERKLETEIVCTNCDLHYAVYGVFGFCPDCGQHNSLQILETNLSIVGKMLDMVEAAPPDLAAKLIENALEDCVSAFDGFGREVCRLYMSKSPDARLDRWTFQNLETVRSNLREHFGFDR